MSLYPLLQNQNIKCWSGKLPTTFLLLLPTSYWVAILGALTISISIIRNSLMVKKKMTKAILTILIIIQIIVGSYLNQLGLIGYLPIISSVSYSLAIAITRNLQWLRWVIIENMLLWLIYDLTIQAYPAAITDITITLTTLIAIIKNRKTFSR